MEREGNSDPIPIDIILEILSRSSNKSIARFGFASKFCASILRGPDFTELFLTRSSTRPPRLLFFINYFAKWHLYSSPQPQNPDEKHSLVVAADFHMEFLGDMALKNMCGPVSGLLYFPNMRISKEDIDKVPVICNPSTGQYARLPQLSMSDPRSLLGYDPIVKQYKVLAISKLCDGEGHILTLGTGKVSWRKIQCPVNHYPINGGICIDGVLYYMARQNKGVKNITCFDVRYEKLRFLNADSTTRIISFCSLRTHQLINYKSKLGVISWYCYGPIYGSRSSELKLSLWTLEDAKKQEWLSRDYFFPVNIVVEGTISVVGVTANGEIIMSMDYASNPFFVLFLNPERKTIERVEIQGFEAPRNRSRVYTFVDYAEDLKFI